MLKHAATAVLVQCAAFVAQDAVVKEFGEGSSVLGWYGYSDATVTKLVDGVTMHPFRLGLAALPRELRSRMGFQPLIGFMPQLEPDLEQGLAEKRSVGMHRTVAVLLPAWQLGSPP